MRRVIAGLAMLMLATPLWGQETARTEAVEHRVQRGETLWELAGRYLDDPHQWRVIYDANADRLTDPDRLTPGQVLMIPAAAPGPTAAPAPSAAAPPTARISIRSSAQEPDPLGDPVADRAQPRQPEQAMQPQPAGQQPAAEPAGRTRLAFDQAGSRPTSPQDPNRTVFYRPPPARPADRPTVLSEPGIERFPVRPGEFRSAAWVGNPSTLDVVGTFLRSIRADPRAWGGEVSAHPNDRILITYGDGSRPEPGTRLVLVHVGDRVRTGAARDRVIDPRGIARVTALGEDAIEARLEAQYGEVVPGQLAVPAEPMPEQTAEEAEPVPGGHDLEGRIVAFAIQRPLHNRTDLAFVDLGRTDGVQLGDVFQAYLPGRRSDADAAEGHALPVEAVAELRVVRVTENTATVKVDGLSLPRLREDLPVRRIRRMP